MDLTIVIPVYNVEKFIGRCLDSVIGLSKINYEIIIVNDGTKDRSIEIVEQYIPDNKNIIIINQENQGLGEARNTGLKHARGEYVYFLDSDDYIDSSSFIALFNKKLPDVDIIIGNYNIEKDNDITKGSYEIETSTDIQLSGVPFFLHFYRKNINTMVWRSIYRRKFLISNNLYFTKGIFHEDLNWTPRVLLKADKILYSPISFYYYQIRSGSIINSNLTEKKFYDQLYAYCDLQSIVGEYPSKVQKEISYISIVGMLVVLGRYWKIVDQRKIKADLKTIMTCKCSHYLKVNVIRTIFLLCPSFVGELLYKKYGR